MKKFLSIVLILFYLPAICGVTLTDHYCCGEVVSTQIHLAPKKDSNQKKMIDCCKDVSHYYKVDVVQQSSSSSISFTVPTIEIPFLLNFYNLTSLSKSFFQTPSFNLFQQSGSPLSAEVPKFIQFQVFRI